MRSGWSGWLSVPLLAALLVGCEVNVQDPGELPEVEVDRGRAPVLETRPADVEIQTEEREVTVPDVNVDVDPEGRDVTVPDVDVDVRSRD